MAEASLRVGSPDMEGEVVFQGVFSQPRVESESQVSKMEANSEQKAGKPSMRWASKTRKQRLRSRKDEAKY